MNKTQADDMQAFGLRIAQERRHKSVVECRDILRKDVAKLMRVSESTVSRWEAGEAIPRDAVLTKLAEYFGVTRPWLRYGEGVRDAVPHREVVPRATPRAKSAKQEREA